MNTIDSFINELWNQVELKMRNSISSQDWCSWFSQAKIKDVSAQYVEIEVVNDFAAKWISSHFMQQLSQCVAEAAGSNLEVVITAKTTIDKDLSSLPKESISSKTVDESELTQSDYMTEAELLAELSKGDELPSVTLTNSSNDVLTPMDVIHSTLDRKNAVNKIDDTQLTGVQPLDPRYRFDNFVIGPSNQMVHAAALSVAESPENSYNPLFIHGPTGLGKTHLLHAIGHYVQETRKDARIAYVTTEQFLSKFLGIVQAAKTDIGRNTRDRFKSYFRDVDVLLMDDIQFLAGRGSWLQEELFHIFNALHGSGKQIVLTSDCQPEAIPKLEDRLRSRFAWGLIADIETPDKETRVAILKRKAMVDDLDVPYEVFELIAENFTSNVRELEGVLTRVVAEASLRSLDVTIDIAQRVICSIHPGSSEPVTIDRIQQAVCEHYSLSREDLLSESRARSITLPRQIGMYLARQLMNAPSTQVAARFNRKDHSTILHAEKRIDNLIRKDLEVHDVVTRLSRELKGKTTNVR